MGGKSPFVDDAGRAAEIIDARRTAESRDPELRELVKLAIVVHQRSHHGNAVLIYLSLTVLGTLVGLLTALTLKLEDPWPQLCALACGCVWILPLVRKSKAELEETLREQLLLSGRCGSCAYTLHDLDQRETSLVACPECGASWRRSRFTRVASGIPDSAAPRGGFAISKRGVKVIAIDLDRKGLPAPFPSLNGVESWLGIAAAPLRKQLRWRLLPTRLGETMLIVVLALGMLLLLRPDSKSNPATMLGSHTPSVTGSIVAILCATALVAQTVRVWSGRTGMQRVAAIGVLLDRGLCGSCARPLHAADDGTTYLPCETCGGRWPVTQRSPEAPRT